MRGAGRRSGAVFGIVSVDMLFVAPGAMNVNRLADDPATENGSAVFSVHLLAETSAGSGRFI
jgi:hypothetical protein